ncbi:unnamed protein product [Cuscuta epithymum]|uniref:Retrotransposon gag domain-containing protein n=1 Tax=Cuscuta epithymum TaxID=186058 RepID=A0AAV0FRQ6_9ASTE|nr:unnamed protein product [Cuscuta epithymum]
MHTRARGTEGLIPLNPNPESILRRRKGRSRNMAGEQQPARRTMYEQITPQFAVVDGITMPGIEAANYQLSPGLINLAQSNQFGGMRHEDAQTHMRWFNRLCRTSRINGVSEAANKLLLFPFTLRDKAQHWLDSHTFATWDELYQAFMKQYCPASAGIKAKAALHNFRQGRNETLSEAWERYKELRSNCPSNIMESMDTIFHFYNGLSIESKKELDYSSKTGSILRLTSEEGEELIETITSNERYWYDERSERAPQKAGFYEVDSSTAAAAKLDALVLKFEKLYEAQAQTSQQQQVHNIGAYQPSYPMYSAPPPVRASYPSPSGQELALSCEMCMGAHLTHTCPLYAQNQAPPVVQNVNFMEYGQGQRGGGQFLNNQAQRGNFQQAGGSWRPENQNQGQRNAPNFQGNFQNRGNSNQPAYVPPHQRQLEPPPVNVALEKTVAELAKNQAEMHQRFSNLEALIRQLGSIAPRQPGSLPSSTEPNPREQVQAITLRSGRTLPEVNTPLLPHRRDDQQPEGPDSQEVEEEPVAAPIPAKSNEAQKEDSQKKAESKKTPPLPFPTRVKKSNDNANLIRFMEHLKQLHINMPFMEALTEMPRYAKFMKDLLTKKRRWEEPEVVDLNAECSAVVLKTMPPKLKDPGSFLVPCSIENFKFNNALADLGASINLMPSSVVMKLGLGELKPTRMSLQLADRSVKYPKGILEDVLVRVDKFIFPVDFVVMDMEEDRETALILGRPFLATARALVDVADGSLSLRVGDDVCTFKLSEVTSKASDPTES